MTDVTVTQEDRDTLLEVLALWQCDRKQEALEHIARHRQSSTEEVERLREALGQVMLAVEECAYSSSKCSVNCGPVSAVNEVHDIARTALTGVKPHGE